MKFPAFLLFSLLAAPAFAHAADSSWVSSESHPGDFPLVQGNQTATLFVESDDFPVVHIAAGNLADDIARVTGQKAAISNSPSTVTAPVVLIGTVGYSPLIDSLISKGLLDVSKIKNQWESFLIATIPNPNPADKIPLLVIAGSDRRGTAYGVYELSQAIGVSPWYWWADVTPAHRDNLYIAAGTRHFGPPSVQYRGIFINDEDWGMNPWASKTFEPEVGNIGPRTYAKIFELLLRLKANTLWPAMHAVSTAFNAIPENRVVADNYAIVMGSSHCEPMLRNNVGEWTAPANQFNFITNPDGVTKYWEERMQTNGKYENLYTIGIRGIHDDSMMGAKGEAQVVPALEKIFAVQRNLLAKYVNPDPSKVPQIFCPYKEVLAYYLDNLEVPPDVTIVFPDDNFGYIRYFPTPREVAARPGGFGVYYHISYLGAPFSYVWLNTTPPALIWEEMSKAYNLGMKKFWILNVGDLKPGEVGIDFFTQMAWDINKWNLKTLPDYLPSWAAQQFGPEHAQQIAALMSQYYRLGFQRKPEELQWNLKGERPRPSDFSYFNYNNEGRLRDIVYHESIVNNDPYPKNWPSSKKDAFYELVGYPIIASALANHRLFDKEMAEYYLSQGRTDARDFAMDFDDTSAQLVAATAAYNNLVGGKWRNMMPDDVLQKDRSYRATALSPPRGFDQFKPADTPGIGVAIEGQRDPVPSGGQSSLPVFDPFTQSQYFMEVFDTGTMHAPWTAKSSNEWINLFSNSSATIDPFGESIKPHSDYDPVSIDWSKAPHGTASGNIVITDGNSTYTVVVPIFNPETPTPAQLAGNFVESDGGVSIEAEHFAHKIDQPGAAWQIIPGLGRTGDAVGVFPVTAPSLDLAQASSAPVLEYPFYLFHPGNITIHYNLIPTQPIRYGQGLRFAFSIDDSPPQLVTITAGTGKEVTNNAWSHNVLDNSTSAAIPLTIAAPGPHTLKIFGLDPGVLLEKIVLDAGGLRPSYLGPPETLVSAKP